MPSLLQHLAETAPVLGQVDGVLGRSQDRHPGLRQAVGDLQRRLAAELDDDALGLLVLDNVQDVLEGQRLEIEPVGDVVIGAHRLGVAVDHDRLVTAFAAGHDRVHAAVVELDALADAVGPAAEDDDLLAAAESSASFSWS